MKKIILFLKKNDIVLSVLAGICIIVALVSIFTLGQTFVYSDAATASKLAKSMIENRSLFPKSWNYCNGEVWLLAPELFMFIPELFLSNQSMARMCGSALIVAVFVIVVIYLYKKVLNNIASLLNENTTVDISTSKYLNACSNFSSIQNFTF